METKTLKKILLILVIISAIACDKSQEEITACGIPDPGKNIPWLSNLINTADKSQSEDYKGTIWLVKYEGNDIFVTDMKMGSGGIAYYFFNCEGKSITPNNLEHFLSIMKLDIVIYSNIPK